MRYVSSLSWHLLIWYFEVSYLLLFRLILWLLFSEIMQQWDNIFYYEEVDSFVILWFAQPIFCVSFSRNWRIHLLIQPNLSKLHIFSLCSKNLHIFKAASHQLASTKNIRYCKSLIHFSINPWQHCQKLFHFIIIFFQWILGKRVNWIDKKKKWIPATENFDN